MRLNWSPWKGKVDCSLLNLKNIYNEVTHKVIWEMSVKLYFLRCTKDIFLRKKPGSQNAQVQAAGFEISINGSG